MAKKDSDTIYLVTVKDEHVPAGVMITEGVESLVWNEREQCMTTIHEMLANTDEWDDDPLVLSYRLAAAVALGHRGGSSTSRAKQAASRANGRRGGRPRKE